MRIPLSLLYPSLCSLFVENCKREDFPGWYLRKDGEWIHYSRKTLKNNLFYLSLALHQKGIDSEHNVGIIAPTSPNWVLADLATQMCHGITIPLFPNISSKNFLFQCEDASVQFLIIENISCLDKTLQESLSSFQLVICIDSSESKPPNGIYWDDLLTEGRALAESKDMGNWIREQLESISPDEFFSIIYTSGSTGRPKGVALTHRHMISQLHSLRSIYELDRQKDTALSLLPIAHVFERMTIYYYTLIGLKVYFADDPKNAASILQEIKPSVMTVVPRILERLFEKMTAAADNRSGINKLLIKKAIRLAKIQDPEKNSICKKIYEKLVYQKMRAAVGDRFKYIISGSSALNKSINRFLLNIGLPVYEGYGLTECSPVVSVNYKNHLRLGSVGQKLAHLEVKIGPQNEILVKGESVFDGYHHQDEYNRTIFTEDGFFKTGDEGYIDKDGYLFIIGRIKEMLKTCTGKYVSPLPIELELSRHPFIESALVIANDRKYVSALIFMNFENTRRHLKLTHEEFDPYKSILSKRVQTAIARHIQNVNKKLNHWEQIQKWTLIADPLSIESGLLTPTLKLRRKAAESIYSKKIESMYSSDNQCPIQS